MRVLIYEAICAGALGDDVPASLLREGQAMLSAVVEDFERMPDVEVIAPKKVSGPFFEKGPDTFFLVIAPEFDDLLRSLSQRVLDAGGRLLGSTPEAIRLTGDKLALAQIWRERGVSHPQTALHNPHTAIPFPPPWVVKPRHGAGSQATYRLDDASDLPRVIAAARKEWPHGDLIVQPYVQGLAASVALLISATQTIPLLPAEQHLSTDGRFRYLGGSMPLPEPWASRAVRLALQTVAGIDGLRGYVGIDLVLAETEDYAIEINPRLTTSYIGLRQLCRQNLAELMLRCVRGEPMGPITWNSGEVRFSLDGP